MAFFFIFYGFYFFKYKLMDKVLIRADNKNILPSDQNLQTIKKGRG